MLLNLYSMCTNCALHSSWWVNPTKVDWLNHLVSVLRSGAPYKKILPRRNRHVDQRPDPHIPAPMGFYRGHDSECPLQLHLAAPREAQEQPGLLPRGEPPSPSPAPQAAALWRQHALSQAPAARRLRPRVLRGWATVLQPRRSDQLHRRDAAAEPQEEPSALVHHIPHPKCVRPARGRSPSLPAHELRVRAAGAQAAVGAEEEQQQSELFARGLPQTRQRWKEEPRAVRCWQGQPRTAVGWERSVWGDLTGVQQEDSSALQAQDRQREWGRCWLWCRCWSWSGLAPKEAHEQSRE